MSTTTRAVGAAALTAVSALAWAAAVEVRWFALRRFTVPVLKTGAAPLRVLHLSDLHLLPSHRRTIDWVRSLGKLDPHLVINTGDNIAGPDSLEPLLRAFEPLLTVPGAFVLGSNDYFAPVPKNPFRYLTSDTRDHNKSNSAALPLREMTGIFRDAGWRDLSNRRDEVTADGRTVALVGVDDAHMDRDRFPDPILRGTQADLRLGVTHAPYRRVLDAMHTDRADLILAGHTHGGQLCVPLWGALVTNCDLDTGRASGLHGWPGPRPGAPGGEDSTWLHVSAGLGTSPFAPVRFACRPEATLLTLVAH